MCKKTKKKKETAEALWCENDVKKDLKVCIENCVRRSLFLGSRTRDMPYCETNVVEEGDYLG